MKFFKKNYLIIIGIIIVGIYSFSPQIFFEKKMGEDYKGIYFSATDAELFYTSRIQEIKDGYYQMGNSYLFENKNDPYLQPPLAEMVMAGFGWIFNLDITGIMIYGSKLFFPIIVWLAMYFAIYVWRKDKKIAFLTSLVIFLSSNLVYHFLDLINIFRFGGTNGFSPYLRPINPQISSLLFFLFLGFFYLSLEKKKKIFLILSSIFFGLSFYVYLYTWTYILTFIVLLIIFFLIKKEKESAYISLKIIIGGILISIPYWYVFFKAIMSPQFEYAATNQGMISTHAFIFSKVAVLAILLCWIVSKIVKLNKKLNYYFWLFLTLTAIIVINQQVITGKELYHGHFHWYYNTPVLIITIILSLDLLVKKYLPKRRNLIILLLSIFFIFNGMIVWINSFNSNFERFKNYQNYGDIVEWINENDLKDKVIVSEDLGLNSMIPPYTSANVYIAEQASWYLVPIERIEHNYLLYLYLKGVKDTDIEEYLKNNKIEISTMSSLDIPEKHYSCTECITEEMINYLTNRYKEFYKNGFLKELNKYKADYIISASDILLSFSFIEPIREINGFIIYKIN